MPDSLGLLDALRNAFSGYMQQRQQADLQTQMLIQHLQSQYRDPRMAWNRAMAYRDEPRFFNSPEMRNAEHYLSARVPGNELYGALAPAYLATKMFAPDPMGNPMMTPQTMAQSPDPYGELKWGMLPMLQRLGIAR